MIPGESSSPESNIRISSRLNENDSDVELQQLTQQAAQPRSATIGADTPPAIGNAHVNPIPSSGNRVDIIGASNNGSQDNGRTRGSSNLIDNERHDKISRKTSKHIKHFESNVYKKIMYILYSFIINLCYLTTLKILLTYSIDKYYVIEKQNKFK